RVTLFEASDAIGGQFNLAARIPGKEEFRETLRWFRHRIEETGVELRLSTTPEPDTLRGYDEIVLATGVLPRKVDFPGHDHPKVVGYLDVLAGRVVPGRRVAIVGAGGIGFDVAAFLVHDGPSPSLDPALWMREWGVDPGFDAPGALVEPRPAPPARQGWLLQRTPGRRGTRLGQTTGWIHRAALRARDVTMLGGAAYLGMEDGGLRIALDGAEQVLAVDHVVVCAGQEPRRELLDPLLAAGLRPHLVGGADVAAELDARRAIDQGSRLA